MYRVQGLNRIRGWNWRVAPEGHRGLGLLRHLWGGQRDGFEGGEGLSSGDRRAFVPDPDGHNPEGAGVDGSRRHPLRFVLWHPRGEGGNQGQGEEAQSDQSRDLEHHVHLDEARCVRVHRRDYRWRRRGADPQPGLLLLPACGPGRRQACVVQAGRGLRPRPRRCQEEDDKEDEGYHSEHPLEPHGEDAHPEGARGAPRLRQRGSHRGDKRRVV